MKCLACDQPFETQQHRGRARICPACAKACRICGEPHKSMGLCQRHHMRWLRSGKPDLKEFIAGGENAGLEKAVCPVCGQQYTLRGHGQKRLTCSRECANIRRRPKNRAAKAAEYSTKRDVLLKRHKAYYGKHGKRWNREKYRRDMADARRYERVRRQAREHYARNSERIQADRRERIENMTADEFARWLQRARKYCREWRRKQRAAGKPLADELTLLARKLQERDRET